MSLWHVDKMYLNISVSANSVFTWQSLLLAMVLFLKGKNLWIFCLSLSSNYLMGSH